MADKSLTIQIFVRIAVFALPGSGVAAWTRVKNSWRGYSSKQWLATDATIHSGAVTKIPQSTNYKVEITYGYFVDEYRSGRYDRTFLTEDESHTFIRRMKDVRVPVRYSPQKPDKSFLEESEIARVEERARLMEFNLAALASED